VSAFPFLWLFGPSGVGKSTVGMEIFRLLSAADVKGAFVDGDQLGLCYPASDDDPGNHRVKAANLTAAWRGFRTAGAECLVLSGYVWSADEVKLYAEAVPETTLTLCRLRAGRAALEDRYVRRGSLLQHLPETLREADELDRSELPAHVVHTDGLSPRHLAQQICGLDGLWPLLPAPRTGASHV
jgi:hypothetical protein